MVHETNSCELKVGSQSVTVHEMTVQQVRAFLQDAAKGAPVDAVDSLILGDCELSTLRSMCTLTDDEMGELKPSELEAVKAKCKELNPHFFALLAKLTDMAKAQPAS
tara:strand:+ start:11009 stop:11329 length:321 start_codon:yes stop_codon:yes gene_type:complete